MTTNLWDIEQDPKTTTTATSWDNKLILFENSCNKCEARTYRPTNLANKNAKNGQ